MSDAVVLSGAADQASGLRRMLGRRRLRVLPVLGGARDVGATTCVLGLACASAAAGQRTLVLDEGASGVAGALGLTWRAELSDLLCGRHEIGDVVLNGPCGVGLVPARKGIAALMDAGAAGEQIFGAFAGLAARPDFLILSLASAHAARLVPCDAELVLVTRPAPEAITATYARIKQLADGHGRRSLRLLVNRCGAREAIALHEHLSGVARRFLAVELGFAGHIESDDALLEGGARVASRRAALFRSLAEGIGQWRLAEYGAA